jgi:hypothetical protein
MDERKFRELVLYVADRSMDDPDFGMTKLNKILFNADFTAFGRLGSAITGVEYQHLRWGPAPRRLLPILREMGASGEASVWPPQRTGYENQRVIPLREADLSLFSAEEISLVEDVLDLMRGMNARRVSDLSHEFFGWQVTDEGETIPYESVLLSARPLTEREMKIGVELAGAES